MSNPRLRLILHWIPAMVGIVVILVESTTALSSTNTSRLLLPIWEKLFGPITPERWDIVHHYIRKTGHFTGYGLISVAFFDSWRVTLERRWTAWRRRVCSSSGLSLLSTLLLASWDEWHQSLLPGRTSSPWDVGIDMCGALTAQLIVLAVLGVFRRRPEAQATPAEAGFASKV